MKNRKIKVNLLLLIFFIVTLLIITLPELIINKETTLDKKILFIIISILEISPFTLLPLIIYNANQRGKKKAIKESLSEIDFKNNKEYYRDILKKHSPAELSYIDNFEINLTKEIISTLLSLQLKNKIIIKDNFIKIIDNNTSDLKETESYILESIKNGKVKIYNPYEMEGSAKKEALENGLIIKNEISNKNNKKVKTLLSSIGSVALIFWGFFILICIFNQPVVDFLNNIVIPNINIIAPTILIIIFIIVIIRYISIYRFASKNSYSYHKSKSYKRTESGEELNKKIEGLKNYLKHFSSLSEKEREEIILWEEYLIYSVTFGLNNKILNELSSLIDITK